MTGLLKNAMDARADALDVPDLDVAAIMRDGEHHVVRRRRTLAGGLLAASLVVAAGVAAPALLPDRDVDGTVAGGTHSYDLAFAEGTVIQDGPRAVETGVRISAFVQGISGYVVADRQGRVHTVVDGETTQVGLLATTDRGRLVSDDDVVAWVDAADGGTLSVLDLATGERTDLAVDEWPGEPRTVNRGSIDDAPVHIAAVDGRIVYVADARGVMAWDALAGDEPELLAAPAGVDVEVRDVKDGQILSVVHTFGPVERNGTTTMVQVDTQQLGPDLETARSVPGTAGVLSPDGRLLALLELERGQDVTLDTTTVGDPHGDLWTPVTSDGHDSLAAYRWLDAGSFAAVAWTVTAKDARQDLLSCEARTGSCTVAVSDLPHGAVVPTGWMSP